MRHCKDCEPAQQIHWVAYTTVILNWIIEPFFDFMEILFKRPVEAISEKTSIPFFRLMTFLRLAHFTDQPSKKDSFRTKCFWDEAIKRGIKMQEFHLGPIKNIFMAEYHGKKITFDGLPRPNTDKSSALKWMDDKGIMKKKFQKVGLPVANGGVAFNKSSALKIFNRGLKPVIAKPNLGSRSRHTTIHINTKDELITAFKNANKISPLVVIEEELSGSLFRGTLVGGKLVGVVKRDPPQVVGDGINTLQILLQKENERIERAGPIFHHIGIDKDTEKELARQNITMIDIPKKGQVVTFSQKTSRGVGGSTTEVTDIIHKDNKEMLEKLATFLDDPLIGVDFIMQDITKSWKEEPHSGIIECNSLPFIDLHWYVLFGKPNNVASKLWDFVMPQFEK
jgi:hypothetical protein